MEIEVTDDIRVAPESKNMIRILSEAFDKRTPIDINGKQYMVVAKSNSVFSMRRVKSVKAAEWAGEGLPPAGTVCEVKGCMSHYLKWNKVTVFAVRGKTVFFDMEDGRWGQTDSHEFRAIRTPEQIAAEERMNKAIALYTAIMNHPGSSPWHRLDSERQEHFLSLVDAGWQQVKP